MCVAGALVKVGRSANNLTAWWIYAARHVRLEAASSFLYCAALTDPLHPRVGGSLTSADSQLNPRGRSSPTVVDRSKLLDRWPPPQPLPLSDCAKCARCWLAGWLAAAAGGGVHARRRCSRVWRTSAREGSTTFAYLNPRRLGAPSLAPLARVDCPRAERRHNWPIIGLPQGFNQGFPVVKLPHAY